MTYTTPECLHICVPFRWGIKVKANGFLKIGCQTHSVEEWEGFSDREINDMADEAIGFWDEYKDFILTRAKKYLETGE